MISTRFCGSPVPKLTPIIVPAIHQARELIDIARDDLYIVCLGKMGVFERHYLVLADFRCVDYLLL